MPLLIFRSLSQQIGHPRTQWRSFEPGRSWRFNRARQRSQNRRLEDVEPDFADVTTMRTDTQHSENRIFGNPGRRRSKRLAAAARTEINDMNSHGEVPALEAIRLPQSLSLGRVLKTNHLIAPETLPSARCCNFQDSNSNWLDMSLLFLSCPVDSSVGEA
jgi:hypothetical protein